MTQAKGVLRQRGYRTVLTLSFLISATRAVLAAASCSDLAAFTMPGVTIQSAQVIAAGDFTPPGAQRALRVGEFCRVVAVAAPSSDSDIHFEVWIPGRDRWNGKLLATGNGGFSGAIGYWAMADALARGYATTGTGGQQALSEAQRFPDDYDGIVAGAPGNDRVRLIVGFLWSWVALHSSNGEPLLTQAQLSRLTQEAVARCDAADALKDGLIDDPRHCDFDPAVLACAAERTDVCLTQEQIAAVRKVYAGAKNPRTGAQLFPGWARGSEAEWGSYLLEPKEPVRLGLFRDFTFDDPAWDWRTFDWDRDVDFVEAQVPSLSAVSPDLGGFRSRGGKLLMYTGWADPVVPPQDIVSYYEAVARVAGGFRKTQEFFRFFGVPGMGHCGGGSGPNTFDPVAALEAWVEHGQAPERLIATQLADGKVVRTRALCAYPDVARYAGSGSVAAAGSFKCVPTPGRAVNAASAAPPRKRGR